MKIKDLDENVYERAYEETMDEEGLYAYNPNDLGGETYAGISRRFHPNCKIWAILDEIKQRVGNDVKRINEEMSKNPCVKEIELEFYEDLYWGSLKLDYLDESMINLGIKIFDTGVNCGTKTASEFIQRACNYLNHNSRYGEDLKVDGSCGNKTISRINRIGKPEILLDIFSGLQMAYYVAITEKNISQREFAYGWAKRAFKGYFRGGVKSVLEDIRDMFIHWADYVDDFFKDKHNLQKDLDKIDKYIRDSK